MTKYELKKTIEGIQKEFGKAEYDMHLPANESARRIVELRKAYLAERKQIAENKKLEKKLREELPEAKAKSLPDTILRESWLLPFNDKQIAVIKAWSNNQKASIAELAKASNQSEQLIRALLHSNAFKTLEGLLANAYLNMLRLPSIMSLHESLNSATPQVKLNASLTLLQHFGDIKGTKTEIDITSKSLDPEREKELFQQAQKFLIVDKTEKDKD